VRYYNGLPKHFQRLPRSQELIVVKNLVPAIFVCRVTLYARERAVPGYCFLVGSRSSKQYYRHLSYVVNMLVPVRYLYTRAMPLTVALSDGQLNYRRRRMVLSSDGDNEEDHDLGGRSDS
jgi:hypothetical protein